MRTTEHLYATFTGHNAHGMVVNDDVIAPDRVTRNNIPLVDYTILCSYH
jgi:hypothetical protein